MRYRTVLFDADGTLFDYQRAEEFALQRACEDAGLAFDPSVHQEMYRVINREIWEAFERKEISLAELRTERFRRFFTHCSFHADPGAFSTAYLGFLAEGSFLLPGARELVHALDGNCRISIITNGIREVQVPRLAASEIAGNVEHLIVSEDAGFPKPNREIFDYTFEKLGLTEVDRQEVLIVGDSLTSDIQGGILYGIDTCWFNPTSVENPTEFSPTWEIRSLPELLPIMRGESRSASIL